jgi:hypothetical protein
MKTVIKSCIVIIIVQNNEIEGRWEIKKTKTEEQ